ncbi:hypothetical protein [Paracoccus haematequi]|uniref:hypothetical protein n=1 Tax=Paracoccus haematequi TaxID=2491866 RepID=UPI000F7F1C64|nr:hypothetical protein [Paracoccus haematequi]
MFHQIIRLALMFYYWSNVSFEIKGDKLANPLRRRRIHLLEIVGRILCPGPFFSHHCRRAASRKLQLDT